MLNMINMTALISLSSNDIATYVEEKFSSKKNVFILSSKLCSTTDSTTDYLSNRSCFFNELNTIVTQITKSHTEHATIVIDDCRYRSLVNELILFAHINQNVTLRFIYINKGKAWAIPTYKTPKADLLATELSTIYYKHSINNVTGYLISKLNTPKPNTPKPNTPNKF